MDTESDKPRIGYNTKTKLWECSNGKLNSLGEGNTPEDAYKFHKFYYNYLRANEKARELLIKSVEELIGNTN